MDGDFSRAGVSQASITGREGKRKKKKTDHSIPIQGGGKRNPRTIFVVSLLV